MIIAIGYCSQDMVHSDFANSMCQLGFVTGVYKEVPKSNVFMPNGKPYNEPINLATIKQCGPNQPKNRHMIVKIAKQIQASKILFVDTDMAIPGDALMKLLSLRKKIVGVDYVKKQAERQTLALDMDDKPFTQKTGVHEAKRIPLGCTLIDIDVFSKIGEPYFDSPWDPEMKDWWSVDFNFCNVARSLGYSIWCDLDLSQKMIHIGSAYYSMEKKNG